VCKYYYLCDVHSISLELIPYFYVDVFYILKSNGISILKCEINGLRLNLNDEQTQSIIDEIKEVLKYDY